MENNFCFNCMEKLPAMAKFCPKCGQKVEVPKYNPIALPPKTILQGRYLVGSVLGHGGFGITYIGYDLRLEMRVAIKELFPASMASRNGEIIQWHGTEQQKKQGLESFVKEARKMAKLDEIPSIVGVCDVFYGNGTAYIVMKYIEGKTLWAKIEREGKMTPEACISLLMPIMEDLCQVHDAGILHRDIKPDNIMITPSGKAMLLDFGAAKELTASQMEDGKNLSSNIIVSHGFSPIEQYIPEGKVGAWTDVYSLCATLYYAVTGNVPYTAIKRLSGSENLNFSGNLSSNFVEALKKGLAVQPTKRTQTVRELVSELKGTASIGRDKRTVNKSNDQSVLITDAEAMECYKRMPDSDSNVFKYYIQEGYTKATERYKKAADVGNADAMRSVGILYLMGNGIKPDYAKAIEWFKKAADRGDTSAMNRIGYMYDHGHGVEQNPEKAVEWYKKAVDGGNTSAMTYIGDLYYHVHVGVEQDYMKAMEWYKQAADRGNTDAMRNIGFLYYCGKGVEQDYTKAKEWIKKAANSGNARAMSFIGLKYEKGDGVKQDYITAMEWYKKAADGGIVGDMIKIGDLYYNGQGVGKDYVKAMEFYKKAADNGSEWAMEKIGNMYAHGKGVPQNYKIAEEWHAKARATNEAYFK